MHVIYAVNKLPHQLSCSRDIHIYGCEMGCPGTAYTPQALCNMCELCTSNNSPRKVGRRAAIPSYTLSLQEQTTPINHQYVCGQAAYIPFLSAVTTISLGELRRAPTEIVVTSTMNMDVASSTVRKKCSASGVSTGHLLHMIHFFIIRFVENFVAGQSGPFFAVGIVQETVSWIPSSSALTSVGGPWLGDSRGQAISTSHHTV